MQNNRGYAPGLTWVTYNQKLVFHLGDTISKSTISPATPDDSTIHLHPYYGMQCDAEMMQQLINQATTTLKTEYILRTNKLALMTNVLVLLINIVKKGVISQQVF